MRRSDRNKYSIKVLIILVLLAGNIVVALPRHRVPQPAKPAPAVATPFSGRLHQAIPIEKDPSSLTN